jgi:uncharacterized surface protein with fasciclin (FAS1) repeats
MKLGSTRIAKVSSQLLDPPGSAIRFQNGPHHVRRTIPFPQSPVLNSFWRRTMRKALLAATAALGLFATQASAQNIVEIAAGAGTFNTLIAAAKAAGLDGALASGENLTVFAPTDEAFAKLPPGTVESLLKPENKAQLAAVLSYHVLPRKLASNQMMKGPFHVRTLKAASGGDYLLAVAKSSSGVTIDKANVVKADIMASNGIIHVIDTVMLPSN